MSSLRIGKSLSEVRIGFLGFDCIEFGAVWSNLDSELRERYSAFGLDDVEEEGGVEGGESSVGFPQLEWFTVEDSPAVSVKLTLSAVSGVTWRVSKLIDARGMTWKVL
ncbi:uncharacterized protein G2W53_029391 [Senna tora]|uniref:Uncharacterized protein n=1 Tax=Senna tora TaxID=362788 RepID=A0A834WAN9_9FABA|nr:uncharacterized protein G2W53_029391 [Senna tora]